jgi:AraC-like DNA-binding protein
VEAIRSDNGSLEGVALDAGWTSANAFARALRSRTGMKPSIVRLLAAEDFAVLVNEQLTLPLPTPSLPLARAPNDPS